MEEAGARNRVRQALSRAPGTDCLGVRQCGWAALRDRVRGRERESVRRGELRCVSSLLSCLTECSHRAHRHDQHAQTWLHTERVLLGAQTRTGDGHAGNVRILSLLPLQAAHIPPAQNVGQVLSACTMGEVTTSLS